MENQSGPERPSSDPVEATFVRPPGLEFAMGVALFAVVLMVFFLIQSGVFLYGVLAHSPDLMANGFSFGLLQDPLMKERMNELVYHGDLVAREAFWSGAICTMLILVAVYYWKRGLMRSFLGLRLPSLKQVFLWIGAFLLLGAVIEGIAALSPAFHTDFMEKVLGSTTNIWLLYLGVGLMAPIFEEFLLRGLLFGSIRHLLDDHATVALTAGVFTAMHMQYDWTVLLLVLPMGVVLGYARARSGSILVPIILHVLNNVVTVMMP